MKENISIDFSKIRKVLVVRLCCIGDIVQTTPALKALKKAGAEVHFLVNPWAADIVDLVPFVDKKHIVDHTRAASLIKAAGELRGEKFDLIINYHRDYKINIFLAVVGAKYRAGYDWRGQGLFLTHRLSFKTDINDSLRYLNAVEDLGVKRDDVFTCLRAQEIGKKMYNIDPTQGARAGIFPGGGQNPGTTMPTKRWPVGNFVKLSEMLKAKGVKVYAFGGKMDGDVLEEIKRSGSAEIIETGSIKEFAYYVSKMDVFVAGDTGPLHVASALGINTIGLFGPTSPALFGPVNKNSVNIWKKTQCGPCCEPGTFHNRKFLECGDNVCMKSIEPGEVLEAAEKMIKGKI